MNATVISAPLRNQLISPSGCLRPHKRRNSAVPGSRGALRARHFQVPTRGFRSTIALRRDERLRDSKRQATSMSLPLAIHHRLDLLADAAGDVNASRAELIGMLIAEAEPEAENVEKRVLAYRKMSVGDIVPDVRRETVKPVTAGTVVKLPVRRPGRPRKRDVG